MEKCDIDLKKYLIERGGHITEEEAVKYIKQLLNGFSALHKLKIIHRDLKTSNILLKNGTIKIGGLLIPRKLESEDIAGTLPGNPFNIAPEVINAEPYGNKVDIWSLGVVFYQMLSEEFPSNL